MKKLLNISVIATLAVLPLVANAAVGDIVSGDPATATSASQTAEAVTASTAPKYALAKEGANDGNLATAGYVKGAYNATMKAINKVSETVNATTPAGVVATIKDATASKTGVSLTVEGTPTGEVTSTLSSTSIDASVAVPTTATVPTLTQWDVDTSTSTATVTLNTASVAVSGTVSGTVTSTFAGTGIDSGTASGDITNIVVTVDSYNNGI